MNDETRSAMGILARNLPAETIQLAQANSKIAELEAHIEAITRERDSMMQHYAGSTPAQLRRKFEVAAEIASNIKEQVGMSIMLTPDVWLALFGYALQGLRLDNAEEADDR